MTNRKSKSKQKIAKNHCYNVNNYLQNIRNKKLDKKLNYSLIDLVFVHVCLFIKNLKKLSNFCFFLLTNENKYYIICCATMDAVA